MKGPFFPLHSACLSLLQKYTEYQSSAGSSQPPATIKSFVDAYTARQEYSSKVHSGLTFTLVRDVARPIHGIVSQEWSISVQIMSMSREPSNLSRLVLHIHSQAIRVSPHPLCSWS
jgi:hypothetical protein